MEHYSNWALSDDLYLFPFSLGDYNGPNNPLQFSIFSLRIRFICFHAFHFCSRILGALYLYNLCVYSCKLSFLFLFFTTFLFLALSLSFIWSFYLFISCSLSFSLPLSLYFSLPLSLSLYLYLSLLTTLFFYVCYLI